MPAGNGGHAGVTVNTRRRATMRRAKYSAKKVRLPNASLIGYGVYYAKPGYWVTWGDPLQDDSKAHRIGRVLGRIECAAYDTGKGALDCMGWLAVMQLSDDLTHAYVRWVDPAWVQVCYEQPPAQLMAWITGDDWPKRATDIPRLIAMSEYGSCSESYIADRNNPDKPYNGRNGTISADEYNAQYVLR
jgi:hypothetical protein